MKLWVPSIGSMYQRIAAGAVLGAVLLADEAVIRVGGRRIRSRIARSIAWSAWVTNVRSGLVSMTEVAPEVRPSPARRPRRSTRGRTASQLVRSSLQPDRSIRSCPDPVAGRVVQRLAGHLEADPLAEHLHLAARPDGGTVRRQVGVRDRALDREPVAARGHPPDDRRRRPGRARCRGRPSADRPGRGSAAACAGRPPSRRRAPRGRGTAPLSSSTANPSPASYGVSSGVMSLDQTR